MATRKKVKEEQPLSPFSSTENHSSNEPLLIDADARASSLESLKSIIGALSFLHELITKGTATVGTRHNTLGISRAELSRLEKFLGAKVCLHYSGHTGKWTAMCKKNGAVLCHGSKQNVEDFLDFQENQEAEKERKRQARIRRRMCKLLNWLYNNKKRR